MIGTTISHYKILEKLGGGGMGVVYKAHDLKLGRDVALKFLPPELTLDPEAKGRFIHEAKAASRLQHNNICTVHDIDETTEGQQFIVMDCYAGETLKKKIDRGPLKIPEAVDLAIQIAQGLSEAHGHGIVHRDVKPANILITSSGIAKIVDFGLAKLIGHTKLTKTGSTLGTVAYMSPEQLQGGDVDGRADIFSLGVVLYEMLTKKTPFRGDHEAALMYSIVNEQPEPLQYYIADVPSELVHILSRALEKSPADRYKTMDDLLIDLRRFRRETSKVSMPAITKMAQQGFTWKRAAFAGISVVIIGALVVVFIFPRTRKVPQVNPDWKQRVVPMPVSNTNYPCLSSDGNWIAVTGVDSNGKGDIYFMNASGGDPRRITEDSASYLRVSGISHDGAWLACYRINKGKREMALVPSQRGEPLILCAGTSPRWSTNNQRLVYIKGWATDPRGKSGKYEVWSIKRDGTDNRLEFIDPGVSGTEVSLSLSPDGKSVAWIKTFPDFSNEIITHNLETGEEAQITDTKSMIDEVFWTADNHIIYSSSRGGGNFDLWMCEADGGEAIQITRSTSAKLSAQLSADGKKLLYNEYEVAGNIQIINLENGKVSTVTSDDRNRAGISISPQNERLAFLPSNAWNPLTVHGIQVIERGKPESVLSLVSDVGTSSYTSWSPDGQWIAFVRRPISVDQTSSVCIVSPSSPGSFRVIGKGEQDSTGFGRVFIRWIDEHTLQWFTPKQMKTWMCSIESPDPRQFYDDSTRAYPIQDGRYTLFMDYRRGRQGWWIDMSPAVTEARGRITKKLLGPMRVSIAPNGRFLLYSSGSGELQRVSLPDGEIHALSFRIQNIVPNAGPDGIGSISRDGKELAYIKYERSGKVVLVENPFIWK